ncbi:hypothetical protein ACT7CU_27475 [Bacillus paranthracis]
MALKVPGIRTFYLFQRTLMVNDHMVVGYGKKSMHHMAGQIQVNMIMTKPL